MPLSRFSCPACGAALTPWLRLLPTADALCMTSWTTLLPAEHWLPRDDPRMTSPWNAFTAYPWLIPPQLERSPIRLHPDPQRTIGCCGLSYRGPDQPNLVCACGEAIGLGYGDCCGPHWYALHAAVRREEADDDEPPADLATGLEHLRRLCVGPVTPMAAARDPYSDVLHDDPDTWPGARRLADLALACSGGEASPELLLTSTQLPDGLPLVLPIPRGQLVRLVVLQSAPWGDPDLPMTWQSDRRDDPRVQLSRRDDRILLTLWPGQTVTAVTLPAAAWTAAWARLRPT